MKHLALIITLVGLLSLFLYLKYSIPLELVSQNQINLLEDNQKVIISGKVNSQKIYEKNILLKLDNNISLNCNKPCPLKLNDKVKILATYDSFYNSLDFNKVIK